jgi:hypothetical protein
MFGFDFIAIHPFAAELAIHRVQVHAMPAGKEQSARSKSIRSSLGVRALPG